MERSSSQQQQQVGYAPCSPDHEEGRGVPLFLRVEDRTKKVYFEGQSLAELRALFCDRFPDCGPDLPAIHIQDQQSKVTFELEHVKDLYPFAVLQLATPRKGEMSTQGYFWVGKRTKLCIAMVGLPARGKSFIARKVARFLNWQGVRTQVFNVGTYRRQRLGAQQPITFFDPENQEASSARLHMAVAALDDMVNFLDSGGRVAIYDATNSTLSRQKLIISRCQQEGFDVMFVESICDDEQLIEENIRDTKLTSPDYVGWDPEAAAADFRKRIALYKKTYSTITDVSLTYAKVIDAGRQVISNCIRSYLQSKIVFFLSNLHTQSRYIWLTRHGESEFNVVDRIGGDSSLTERGVLFSRRLADWAMERNSFENPLIVWTSTLKRTLETAQYIPSSKIHLRALDEIDAGYFDGWTYSEIEEKAPEEFRLRAFDKLNYRYPRGESYNDVIARLEPIIFEMERTRQSVLIIAHQAVLRCLYAYLMNRDLTEVPYIPIPMNTVIELQPKAYGAIEKRYLLDGPVVDK